MKKNYSNNLLALAFVFTLGFAKAQFTGSFVAANWGSVQISCDGYVDLTNAPTSISLISGDDGSGNPGTIDFTITVPQSGNLSFDWDYSTVDDPDYDYPLYLINGTEYPFSTYDNIGSLTQNGSETCISLMQGDVFAFRMYTGDNVWGRASVEISNFSFSTGIVVTPPSATVCAGAPISFSASGGSGYNWSDGIVDGVPFNAPAMTSTYVVDGMIDNCFASTAVVVTILTSPTLAISGIPSNVCSGIPLTLTVSGASTYNWPAFNLTTNTITITPSTPTVITVQGSLATCSIEINEPLNVLQSPTLSLTGANQICAGKSATLLASGADSYVWNILAQTSGVVVSPANTSTYSVTGYLLNGCSSTISHTVTVNSVPTVSITQSTSVVCIGQALQLTASGASTYTWNNAQTNANISVTPTMVVANYSVVGTTTAGCSDSESFVLIASTCVGLQQNSTDSPFINLYPNPSNGFVSIESARQISSLQITDLNGKVVGQFELSDNSTTLNIGHLSHGVYFVKVYFTDNNSYTIKKLVVAK